MCLDSLPKCCTYIEQIFSDVTAILLPAGIIYAATIPTNPATSNSTEAEIERCTMRWFQLAGDRHGGRMNRELSKKEALQRQTEPVIA